jgi:hypothetical protein
VGVLRHLEANSPSPEGLPADQTTTGEPMTSARIDRTYVGVTATTTHRPAGGPPIIQTTVQFYGWLESAEGL